MSDDLKQWTRITKINLPEGSKAASEARKHCTHCGTHVAHTEDWTLWPWPDGAELCSICNSERHEHEDYTEVERRAKER